MAANHDKPLQPIEVAVAGAGGFGRSLIVQMPRIASVNLRVALDIDPTAARNAFRAAGYPDEAIADCSTPHDAELAWSRGQAIVATGIECVIGLPFAMLLEATGQPEVAARHAKLAIEHNKHVGMVSKEADSVVGPVLAHYARQRGRCVAPVDGDQPSLLIDLVAWARLLGFEVIAAGKSSEYDFVASDDLSAITCNGREIGTPDLAAHWTLGPGVSGTVAARRTLASDLAQRAVPDLCELAIVANATGLKPDTERLHAPVARILEIPSILTLKQEGGLLDSPGTLDIFNCLRRKDEVSFGGGVFVVVRCTDDETWALLEAKGHILSRDRRTAMIFNPRHLLGLEASTTIVKIANAGSDQDGFAPKPVVDLVGRAREKLASGTVLTMHGHHHVIDGVEPELAPAAPLSGDAPLPFYLAANRRLRRSVPAGAYITMDDVEISPDSVLLELRRAQDAIFLG